MNKNHNHKFLYFISIKLLYKHLLNDVYFLFYLTEDFFINVQFLITIDQIICIIIYLPYFLKRKKMEFMFFYAL